MRKFWSSSIGKKILMALSGGVLVLFLIAHLLGNLEIFAGRDAINTYSAFLLSIPKMLWSLRIGIIVAFVVHLVTSVQLSLAQRAARPVKYLDKKSRAATLASRTMLLGGLVVLSFVLFHLAHLTFGITNPDHAALVDEKGRHDVYSMVVLGFQDIRISLFYILAQIFLGFHLSHGFSSAAQTLGITTVKTANMIRVGGIGFAVVLCLLYVSIPFAVLMGWLSAT